MLGESLLYRWCFTHPWVLAVWVASCACLAPAFSADNANTNPMPQESGSALMLANRQICVFRAKLDGYSPEERAAAAQARLESVLARAKTMRVTTETVTNGIRICLDRDSLFVITPADVLDMPGQTLHSTATEAVVALGQALQEIHSLSTPAEVLTAIGKAVLGLIYLAAFVWFLRRAKTWLLTHSAKLAADKTKAVRLRVLRTAGLRGFVAVLRTVLNLGSHLFTALFLCALVWYELRCFPYSRPWGDFLRMRCISALAALGHEVLNALPELMIITLILLLARMAAQGLSRVFSVVEQGELEAPLLDPMIAATTRRILVWLVWVIAAVVAYPYIPGSQSLAFKGVTVFAGLLVSLGSTNVVSQIASGLVLIYSRAYRVGDYVRAGPTEGSVVGIGLCVTRIRTIQNEEVHIANNVLLGTATINYSRLAKSEGLYLAAKVSVGYATPWRQVHALLLQAASQTAGLAAEPAPFVLQTALSDFYVEYQVNATLTDPTRRAWVQSDLHKNIQDAFNEHNVQIMSPHYFADPLVAHVVPKSKWFLPPAKDAAAPEARGAHLDKGGMVELGL